ncbi:MAG TPA: hypothetical protein VK969_07785 [Acidimicrobiia bacterium]|nr:hypothetical protein [Acidimicrobiia bacterium]
MKMFTRAGRAALFDRKVYTEAFFDNDAMADGAIVVASVGALTYLGFLARGAQFDLTGLIAVVLYSVVSWLILGFATWFAANRLFQGSGRPQTLLAMHGLAPLPLLLEILGTPIAWLGVLWYLGILVLATKEGTDLEYKFAGVAVLIGFAAAFLVRALLRVPYGLFSGAFV